MSIWGKIVGSAAGFAFGGPLGALLGGIAGHAVDVARTEDREGKDGVAAAKPGQGQEVREVAFTIAVIALGAKMAKADGHVTRDEIAAFREVFQVPEGEEKNVARVFNMARVDVNGFETYARQVGNMFAGNRTVLGNLLDGLFHIALADGEFDPAEDHYLSTVATLFGFTSAEYQDIRAAHVEHQGGDPWRVLGLERTASADDIKARYRKLAREHHPDSLMAQGLPQEFVESANRKLSAINAAYDEVMKARGARPQA